MHGDMGIKREQQKERLRKQVPGALEKHRSGIKICFRSALFCPWIIADSSIKQFYTIFLGRQDLLKTLIPASCCASEVSEKARRVVS
jgi:hypothetical protein